ncbi:hypothetical protein IWW50_006295 [Coemansia erecta]|nr:hypothetical protein IWW50_006295 [Coemansia erecta]
MHALVREFMGTEAPSSSVDSPNHILLEATPVIELLYNYMNPASAEEVFEAPQSKVSEVSADQGPINRLVAAFMNSDVEVAATAAPEDVYEYAAQSETLNEAMFDFNSWGDRVDSAAHRLVNNVEGIIVHFLPTSSVAAETGVIAAETDVIAADTGAIAVETDATVAPETDTVDARVEDITAATNNIGFNVGIDAEEAESSSAHWYEFL